jgi:hypothetical protein
MPHLYDKDRCVVLLSDKDGKIVGAKYNEKEIPLYSFSINYTELDDTQTVTITVPMRIEIKDGGGKE